MQTLHPLFNQHTFTCSADLFKSCAQLKVERPHKYIVWHFQGGLKSWTGCSNLRGKLLPFQPVCSSSFFRPSFFYSEEEEVQTRRLGASSVLLCYWNICTGKGCGEELLKEPLIYAAIVLAYILLRVQMARWVLAAISIYVPAAHLSCVWWWWL